MGALLWVKVPSRVDHNERSEAQLHEGDRVWEGSVERSCGPMNKNRIEGVADFRLAQTPRVWRELDQWLRHRLRAIQLKQWKRGTTMYGELLALGAKPDVARQVAANSRRWWRNSGMLLNSVLTLNWSDRLGLPRLS
jgi:hypothetical protein